MKRVLTPLFFLCLAVSLPSHVNGQVPAQFTADCKPCHAGTGGIAQPTAAEGFGYGGWDALLTRMGTFTAISAGDRNIILNYLESNFAIGTPDASSGPGYATPPTLPSGTGGVFYSQTMTGFGGTAPYTWSVSGQPTGMSISSGGVLSGTPGAAGTFTLTFTLAGGATTPPATCGIHCNLTTSHFVRNLTIAPPATLTITGPALLSAGMVGTAYSSVQFTSSGGFGGNVWSATGLPANMSISAAGVLSGTPAAGTQGAYNPQFTVTDASNAHVSVNRALTINPPQLQITGPGALSAGTVGTAYTSVQFTSVGGAGGNVWTATGLPANMSISAAGVLSGTPAAGTQGAYNPQFTVTDSSAAHVSVNLALTINPPQLQITGPGSLSAGTVGTAYASVQFTSSGGTGGNVWTATGLPANMSISAAGVLSGTPAAGTQGAYNPQFTVTDSSTAHVSVNLALTISVPLLQITGPPALSNGTEAVPYTGVQFTASGGTGGFVWTATGLPANMSISAAGILSGTPAVGTHGSYNPQFKVTDSSTAFTTVNISLTIGVTQGPPVITSMSPSPVVAAVGVQTIFINGSGFQNGAGLKVHVSNGGFQTDLTGAQVTFFSSTQISISLDVGTVAASWTATAINPDTQSSNVFGFTVIVAQVTTYALPQFTFGGAWYTALYFSNPTNGVVHITVNFFANDGSALVVPLAGIGSFSSRAFDLNPHSTAILEALNGGGAQVEGWAEVGLPTGATGYAVFRQVVPGRADQEAVVPLTPEDSQTADFTYDNTAFITSVAFLNPTPNQVTVTINTFDTNGLQNGTAQQVLAARSKISARLQDLSGLSATANVRGRATFSIVAGGVLAKTQVATLSAVSVLGLRFGGSAFTSIPVFHRPAVAETRTITFAVPQFIFGGAWDTALYFSNTTSGPLNVQTTFTADNGAPLSSPLVGIGSVTSRTVNLAAGATATLEVLNGGAGGQGWVAATVPPGVTGYAVFRQVIPGRENQEAVVPLTSETDQAADLVYDDTAFDTSVAFLNPSDQLATVSITIFNAGGSQIAATQVPLAPHTKTATRLRDLPGLSVMLGNRGWASFSVPNGDVSVLGLRFGGEAFTSIPVQHK